MKKLIPFAAIPNFLKLSASKQQASSMLTHVGKKMVEKVSIHMWTYDENTCTNEVITTIPTVADLQATPAKTWLNVVGLHDTALITEIGEKFNLHPLLLEDVLNTHQRPKIEEYDNCLFIVVKMLYQDTTTKQLVIEQMSMVLMQNVLLTFQERQQDVFDPVRIRLEEGKGKIRTLETDYLTYRLLDAVVDGYFTVLEDMGEQVEAIENLLLQSNNDSLITSIHALRQQTLFARKAIHPLREVISMLSREETAFITSAITPFIRDLYDHTIQAIDAVDTFREMLSNALDNYLSLMSHKMNSVMKVLTIVGSIFIPLTFIVGVYGMNFTYMPELKSPIGYPMVWAVMVLLTIGMLYIFKKKNWL